MSLLSSFIRNHLLAAVEAEFSAHAPEVQSTIVNEVNAFASEALAWVDGKLKIAAPEEAPQGE
jgi:hypothetical protein